MDIPAYFDVEKGKFYSPPEDEWLLGRTHYKGEDLKRFKEQYPRIAHGEDIRWRYFLAVIRHFAQGRISEEELLAWPESEDERVKEYIQKLIAQRRST